MKGSEIYCAKVEPFLVEGVWEKCLPFLSDPELSEIEYTSLEEVKENCKNEDMQLWMLYEDEKLVGAFNTNIGQVSSTIRVVNIFNLSGTGSKFWTAKIDEKICNFGRENGCSIYTFVGRKGFSRYVEELKSCGEFFIRKIEVQQ